MIGLLMILFDKSCELSASTPLSKSQGLDDYFYFIFSFIIFGSVLMRDSLCHLEHCGHKGCEHWAYWWLTRLLKCGTPGRVVACWRKKKHATEHY